MTVFHVRPATIADLPALCALGRQVFTETYGAAIPPDILKVYLARTFTPAALQPVVERHEGALFVGYVGESNASKTIQGYCKVHPAPLPTSAETQSALELTTLYIGRSAQGCGLGSLLLQTAIDWATAAGYAQLWLCVWRANSGAIRFYRRNGFTHYGQTTVTVIGATPTDRVDFTDEVMVRTLLKST